MEKTIKLILPKIFFAVAFLLCAYTLYFAINPSVFLRATKYMGMGISAAVFAFCGLFLENMSASDIQKEKNTRSLMSLFFAYYIIILVCLTFFNGYSDRLSHFSLESHFLKRKLLPFSTFKEIITRKSSFNFIMSNLLGNVFSFMPLSWFMAFFFEKMRKPAFFIPFLFITVFLLETTQGFFCLGEFDTDDIILNFTGAAFAYLLIIKTPACKLLPKK